MTQIYGNHTIDSYLWADGFLFFLFLFLVAMQHLQWIQLFYYEFFEFIKFEYEIKMKPFQLV